MKAHSFHPLESLDFDPNEVEFQPEWLDQEKFQDFFYGSPTQIP